MDITPPEILGLINQVWEGLFRAFWLWGWIILPLILWPLFIHYYLIWRQHRWDAIQRPPSVLLEIRVPTDVIKPIRAMEAVLHGFWQLYGPPNWYEKWVEGEQELSFSLEILGKDGVPHFLVRVPKPFRNLFESHIYAQYGDAEIYEVEDYVKDVPSDIPNQRWDMMGNSYQMDRSDIYPIRTYVDFETERETDEEKRIDPIAGLLENIAKLGKGEQMWIQIKAKPIDDSDLKARVEAEKNKILQRKKDEPASSKTIPEMISDVITLSRIVDPEKQSREEGIPPEMRLSPGEKRELDAMERKRAKKLFKVHIHHIYLAKKEVFFKPTFKFPMSYFNTFSNQELNSIRPCGKTVTKAAQEWYNWFIAKNRRAYLLKRKLFKVYKKRLPCYYPNVIEKTTFTLNTEELASLFHIPSKGAVPSSVLPRVESVKKEAPWGLPVEDE